MLEVDSSCSSCRTRINFSKTINLENHLHSISTKLLSQILEKSNINNDIPRVFIRDVEKTRRKLETFIMGGNKELEVVTDFDRTLSKYRHNGSLIPTCHGIFEMDPELTETSKSMLIDLRNKYYPIEMDPILTEQEKIPYMLKWWEASHDIIVKCGIHRATLEKTVKDCCLVLRDRVPEFFKLLHDHEVPVLIFSAGLGDVIDLFLNYSNVYYDNMRIVSNFMRFNKNGELIGFTTPIIHIFNKTAATITNDHLPKRPCVLLLGDSTGDVHMADGATVDDPTGCLGTVLRIGFLNEAIEENLEKFQSNYDIVLVNDDSFDIPFSIIKTIIHQSDCCLFS